MGKIIYNGIDCGGGGSGTSIEPNPSETATDTLEKLGINGTVYDFEGTTYTAGTNIQINENVISATDTTYSAFQGTDGTEVGSSGLVPAPAAADTNKYLKSDGTWAPVSGGGGSGNVDDVYVNGTSVLDANHIAQVTSYKELTQAQYDALPASKLTDNILYCIKDVGIDEGDKFAPIIYSLDEREIGTWIDGKPLYQKTFVQQLSGSTGQINLSGYDMESAFIVDGYYDIGVTKLALNEYMSGSAVTYTHINTGLNPPYIDCKNTIAQNSTIKITVAYTKTTDVPGSGSWTTSGVPAVHYSTNEQVIGTWIDGKPLYQKSYNYNNQIAKSAYAVLDNLLLKGDVGIFMVADAGFEISGANNIYGNYSVAGKIIDIAIHQTLGVYIENFTDYPIFNINVTVQYTKTTD